MGSNKKKRNSKKKKKVSAGSAAQPAPAAAADASASDPLQQFLQAIIAEAVTNGGADAQKLKFDEASGILSMDVNGTTKALSPATLFPDYIKLADPAAKHRFVQSTVKTYISGSGGAPADYDSARPMLRPRLQTLAYFKRKQSELPQGQTIPYVTLSQTLSRSPRPTELAVGVVVDLGHATCPVLSGDLVQWGGRPFEKVLEAAIHNLRAGLMTNEKLDFKKWNFGKHASGCCQSEWSDAFDSTRAVVVPEMIEKMGPGRMPGQGMPNEAPGDPVCTFAAHRQCLAAGAKMPLSLCFMGDMRMDVVAKAEAQASATTAAQLTNVLLSPLPYRLAKKPTPKGPAHPLHFPVPGQPGHVYAWELYSRGEGEFSVPSNQEEVDAIIQGVQNGRVPVFDESKDASTGEALPESSDEKADRLKQEGNALFGQKQWKAAMAKYSEAIDTQPMNHLLYGNRAMCSLKLADAFALKAARSEGREQKAKASKQVTKHAKAALEDAENATKLEGKWGKGWARQGAALRHLGRLEEAADAFRIGLNIQGLDAVQAKQLRASLDAVEVQIKDNKERAARERVERMERDAAARALGGTAGGGGGGGDDSDDDMPPTIEDALAPPPEEHKPVYLSSSDKFDLSKFSIPGLSGVGASGSSSSTTFSNPSLLAGNQIWNDFASGASGSGAGGANEIKSIFSLK